MMRYLAAILLIISGAAQSQPWGEQTWKSVAFTNTGSVWYARLTDLNTLTGDRRKIWIKQDHSRDKTLTIRETMTLYWVECSTLSLAQLSWASTRANGSVVSSGDIPEYQARFARAVPESVGEALAKSICAAGTPWAPTTP